jgi:hypothetical protein
MPSEPCMVTFSADVRFSEFHTGRRMLLCAYSESFGAGSCLSFNYVPLMTTWAGGEAAESQRPGTKALWESFPSRLKYR